MKKQLINYKIRLAALLFITALIYLPALRNQFNNLDDVAYFTKNNRLELTVDNIKKSFTTGEVHGMYMPVTALSNSLIHHFFGLNPKPYILTNLLIHLLNIVLLWIFLSSLFSTRSFKYQEMIAFTACILFAIHPTNAGLIAYGSGKRDLLFCCFYLTCLIFYVKSAEEEKKQEQKKMVLMYLLSLLFGVLSMLSKGSALVLIGSLLITDLYLTGRWKISRLIPFVPFVIFIALKVYEAPKYADWFFKSDAYFDNSIPYWQRFVYACAGLGDYIVRAICPLNLSIIHPYPFENGKYVFSVSNYFSIAVVAVLVWFFIKRGWTKNGLLEFGVLFFLVNIVMLLQIIPNTYGMTADHYFYLSGIGVYIALAYFLTWLIGLKGWRKMIYIVAIWVIFLSSMTIYRISTFKNDVTMWEDVLKKYPTEKLANFALGFAYEDKGNQQKAIYYYTKILNDDPTYTKAAERRAILFSKNGYNKEALSDLSAAINIDSSRASLFMNRGSIYGKLNQYPQAISDLSKAISLQPEYGFAFANRAYANLRIGNLESALADCKEAKRLMPNDTMLDRMKIDIEQRIEKNKY